MSKPKTSPRLPSPRRRPSSVIVLQDFTDADATVKCSALHDSDLPQFELPPICDAVAAPADPYAAYAHAVQLAHDARDAERLASGQVRVDSVGGVVLSDLDDEPAAASGVAPSSLAPTALDARGTATSIAPVAMGTAVATGTDDSSDLAARRFERSLRRGSIGVRALLAGAAAAAVVLVVGLAVTSGGPMAASTSAADTAFASARGAEPVRLPAVSPEALSEALVDVGDGVLSTSALPPGTEVYVDGALAGRAPEALHVRCGLRIVDVGKTTTPRKVDVPCGGEAKLR